MAQFMPTLTSQSHEQVPLSPHGDGAAAAAAGPARRGGWGGAGCLVAQARPLDFNQSPAITEADAFSSTDRLFMAIRSSGVSSFDTLFRVSVV